MNLKESIIQVLTDKKAKREGLHIRHIAKHVFNSSRVLFSEGPEQDYEKLLVKVNRILLYEANKKQKGIFIRVINPKTKKNRKGWYKLK